MHGNIPLKLSHLLAARQSLQQAAQLANLAYACHALSDFAARVERAGLTGLVRLESPEASEEGCWARLTALQANQSLIEEHFTDEDLMDLADTVAFVTDADVVAVTFRIEQLRELFVTPLRAALAQGGVELDLEPSHLEQDASSDLPSNS